MKWRVLIACPHLQSTIGEYRHLFVEHGVEIEVPGVREHLRESELLDVIGRFDGVIAGDDEFTASVLERAHRLKVISKWGVGIDAIDVDAAKRLGIRVYNTPNALTDEVADAVMGYIILLARRLHKLDASVRAGGWAKITGTSLRGKTLGIIGLGSIGRAVARRAVAAGMPVVGCDIAELPERLFLETGLTALTFEEVVRASEFLSINCSLTQSNQHMLGEREFKLMKTGVHIVNTARGALIDEAALVQALRDGKVAGAALDVFEQEPLALDSPLRDFDNCIFGTHNSSNTAEALARVNELAIRNLLEGLRGGDV